MPELPEVETIVRQLRPALIERRVEHVTILRDNVVRGAVKRFERAATGSRFVAIERRAKFIVFGLEGGAVWWSHLRMSGRWQIETDPEATRPTFTRAVFGLDDGARLLFVDTRTLGEMEIVSADAWATHAAALGPEPLEPSFTPQVLLARLRTRRRPVKTFLLDQANVAGLGNIYVAEALWRARISPRRKACNIGPVRVVRLHRAIVEVLAEAIDGHGTSLGATYLNFADADGERGAFYERLMVYDREGDPCSRCGRAIRRIVQDQRSTCYCPGCQQ